MSEAPASSESLPQYRSRLRLPWLLHRRASELIGDGSVQHKTVRFGNLEPTYITLVKRSILPSLVVLTLALCMHLDGQHWSLESYALALVAFLIAAQIFGPLNLNHAETDRPYKRISRMLLEWSCVVAILMFLSLSFKLTQDFPRSVILSWFLLTPATLLLADWWSAPLAKWFASVRALTQRYIIIGANDLGFELARRIDQTSSGGTFYGFFDYRSAERVSGTPHQPVKGNCSARDFADIVRSQAITHVYLAMPISTTPRIEDLIKELRDTTASIYFVPNIFAFDLVQARCVEINGMPALSICDSPVQGMSGVWKQVFDVVLATLVLATIWPILLGIALAIKATSPGPVLFKQRRYGLHGEEILVYKFRTMTVCEDGSIVEQATKQDRRITRLGAFLRRMSLDELPQILNVLEGKMSFVGPRPHAVAHNEAYRKLINGYMIRHKVRPGITGWAQVNGLRGETASVEKMHVRVQYDLDYLKNWSLWLDVRIIARTALIVLRDRNAY